MVDCPADDDVAASQVEESACFVVSSQQIGMVTAATAYCTDYVPLKAYLSEQEASATSNDDGQVNFDCGPLDAACKIQEDFSNDVADFIVDSLEWVFGNSGLNTSSPLYQNALDQAGFWWTVTSFFTIGAAAIGIGWSAIRGNRAGMIRAVIGLAATFASTWVAIFVLGYVLDIMDGLTEPILQSGVANGSIPASIRSLLFPDGIDGQIAAFGNLPAMLSIVGLALGLVVIVFVNSLRDFGLMVLIAFGPLAFALLPVKEGGAWIRNWASAVLALLLTKPLILGLLVLILSGAGGLESIYSIQALPLLIGFVVTLFMPFLAFGLFSFIGASAGSVDQVGQGAARGAQSAAYASRMLPRSGPTGGARGSGPAPAAGGVRPSGGGTAAPPAAAPPTKSPAITGGRWTAPPKAP